MYRKETMKNPKRLFVSILIGVVTFIVTFLTNLPSVFFPNLGSSLPNIILLISGIFGILMFAIMYFALGKQT